MIYLPKNLEILVQRLKIYGENSVFKELVNEKIESSRKHEENNLVIKQMLKT